MPSPPLVLIIVLGMIGAWAGPPAPLQAEQPLDPQPSSTSASAEAPQPNFLLRLSAETVSEGLRDGIDEVNDVDENIMGRQVRGQGRLIGEYSFRLVPHDELAIIRVDFSGVNTTNTVTEAGPVCLFVRGKTGLRGATHIYVRPDNIRADPAQTNAETNTCLVRVTTRFKRQLIERIAQKIATREFYSDKAQRDRVAAQRSAEDFNEEIDEEAEEFIDGLTGPTLQYVRRVFSGEPDSAGRLKFRTTQSALEIAVLPLEETTASAPPSLPEGNDLQVYIHESLINNIGTSQFAGRTLTWDEVLQIWEVVNGRFYAPVVTPEEESEPVSITLADEDPIRFTMQDGAIDVTVRGEQFTFGGGVYPSMDIHLRYELQRDKDGAPRLVRSGAPRVVPGRRGEQDPAQKVQDVVQQQLIRALLLRDLEEDLTPGTLTAAGEIDDLGTFTMTDMNIADGWLTLAYRRLGVVPPPQ
ncbi:MAG: hypothetical protein KY475_15540 [Planctomycetes bacterium]|nr:hypothetical protein [Planctomycetota bacterium]